MKTISKAELMNLLGSWKSVENAPSRNGENEAPNQFYIRFENGVIFQSYKSLIGARINGNLYFSDKHDYSTTTSLHTKKWCGYNTKERREGLRNGAFTLITD